MKEYISKNTIMNIVDVCYDRLKVEHNDNRGLSDEAIKNEFCLIDIKLPRQIGKTQSVCDFISYNCEYNCAVVSNKEHLLQTYIDRIDSSLVQFHKNACNIIGDVDIIFDVSDCVSIDDIDTNTLLFKII